MMQNLAAALKLSRKIMAVLIILLAIAL